MSKKFSINPLPSRVREILIQVESRRARRSESSRVESSRVETSRAESKQVKISQVGFTQVEINQVEITPVEITQVGFTLVEITQVKFLLSWVNQEMSTGQMGKEIQPKGKSSRIFSDQQLKGMSEG